MDATWLTLLALVIATIVKWLSDTRQRRWDVEDRAMLAKKVVAATSTLNEIHMATNGSLTAAKKALAISSAALAAQTKDPNHVEAARIAEEDYQEHVKSREAQKNP